MYYSVYRWPAGAPTHRIEFLDVVRKTVTLVEANHVTTTYRYGCHEDQAGILLVYPITSPGPDYQNGQGRPYAFPINNPPSLATLRGMVREAMNDTTTETGIDLVYPDAPKWGDREIDNYVREGIGFINRFIQREVIIETTREHYRDDLITRAIEIVGVSFYDTQTREWMSIPRFSRRGHRGTFHYWDLNAGRLALYGAYPPNVLMEIHMRMPYPIPMNDTQEILVDAEDWDILSIYAQAKCYTRLAGQSAQLDRWKEEGKRNDNPITPIACMLMQEAEKRIQDRRGPRSIRRYRA